VTGTEALPPLAREALSEIVRRTIARSVDDYSVVGRRSDYFVVEASAGLDRLIVKLAGPASTEPDFRPAVVPHQIASARTSVPMSKVLVADDSMSFVPYRYSVQTKVNGEPWFSRSQRLTEAEIAEALGNIGAAVADLHSARVQGYGRFGLDDEVSALEALRDAMHRHAARIVRSPRLLDRFDELLERRRGDFTGTPDAGIVHEDLHGFNILFDPVEPTQIAAILDFDKAWAGPIESDIARLELWRGMSGPTFMDTYRSRHTAHDGYERRRPIYQLLWCYEFAVNSLEHLRDTNDLHGALGLSTIEDFS
jgi:Ser/Thr protein kinase RdoA (MazF antagonist)